MSKLPTNGTSPARPACGAGEAEGALLPGGCGAGPPPDWAGRGAVTYPGHPLPGTGPAQPPPTDDGIAEAGGVEGCRRLRDMGRNRPTPCHLPGVLEGAGAAVAPRLPCSPRLFPAPGCRAPRSGRLVRSTWFTEAPAPSYRTGTEHGKTGYKYTRICTCASTVRAEVQRAYAPLAFAAPGAV